MILLTIRRNRKPLISARNIHAIRTRKYRMRISISSLLLHLDEHVGFAFFHVDAGFYLVGSFQLFEVCEVSLKGCASFWGLFFGFALD